MTFAVRRLPLSTPMNLSTLLLGVLATACFGTPTPLAPGIEGSVGVPHNGVQTNGVELSRKAGRIARYRPHSPYHFGNPRLVRAIEEAVAAVHEAFPDTPPLVVGDLSDRFGGRIPRHRSHRTGRDVDLLWYVTTPAGAPIRNPGFLNVDTDGLAPIPGTDQYVRLDVERQWVLVRSLLTSEHIDVQWMFCSRSVEALLIDYARARDEDPELVWHAATVLLQPGDSLPHDDHIHLRIACSPEEAVAGCEGGGPRWEWLPPLPRLDADDDWLYVITAADPFPEPADDTQLVGFR